MPEKVLRFEDALAVVLAHAAQIAPPSATESVALLDAAGRTLAAPVAADRDQPPFDRSTRDGFAVRAADVEAAETLRVVGVVRAGERWLGAPLAAGEAIEIMTGAPLPEGADAVLMVEHAALVGDVLTPDAGRRLAAGENVVARGAEAHAGQTVLPPGRCIGAAEIAVAASCGVAALTVYAQPEVAIAATGDELVELGEPMASYQIRNSNSYAIAALVRAQGGSAGRLQIASDTHAELFGRIAQGSMWDLLLLSGGVSMGKYDLVEEVLQRNGAEFFFTGALIQPGKPVVFGRLPKRGEVLSMDGLQDESPWTGAWTYFFGLPGNPVSTQVCFLLFVAPLLRALHGRRDVAPVFVEARLAEDIRGGAKVTRFLPAELTGAWDGATVRVVGWQGSGDLAANARGNGYCVLPAGVEHFHAGEPVRVLLR